ACINKPFDLFDLKRVVAAALLDNLFSPCNESSPTRLRVGLCRPLMDERLPPALPELAQVDEAGTMRRGCWRSSLVHGGHKIPAQTRLSMKLLPRQGPTHFHHVRRARPTTRLSMAAHSH